MVGFMRLLVCGGLFVAGYYLGRQSYRLELAQNPDDPEQAGAAPEAAAPSPDKEAKDN